MDGRSSRIQHPNPPSRSQLALPSSDDNNNLPAFGRPYKMRCDSTCHTEPILSKPNTNTRHVIFNLPCTHMWDGLLNTRRVRHTKPLAPPTEPQRLLVIKFYYLLLLLLFHNLFHVFQDTQGGTRDGVCILRLPHHSTTCNHPCIHVEIPAFPISDRLPVRRKQVNSLDIAFLENIVSV